MHHKDFLAINWIFLLITICNCQNGNEISLNYQFDYQSIVESRISTNDFKTSIFYHGKVETSAYSLSDKQELLLLKFNVFNAGQFRNETNSITSIIIRNAGIVERIIVDEVSSVGMVNLLKGIVNLFNVDEKRENKVEADLSGECFTSYQMLNQTVLLRSKTGCNKTTHSNSFENRFDSFSLYKESNISIFYEFGVDGSLMSINSMETHSLEPVLFPNLIGEYRSSTTIKFTTLTKSRSLINSAKLDSVIRIIIGNNYRELFLPSSSEVEQVHERDKVSQIRTLLDSEVQKNRSIVTLKLVKFLRQLASPSSVDLLMRNKLSQIKRETLHDAAISCGTKICSEFILRQLDISITTNAREANRMLISLQNTRAPNEFLVKKLWLKVTGMSHDLYNQGIQTVSSLLELCRNSSYLEPTIAEVAQFIKSKISLCPDDHCLLVYLSAIKNSRMESFQRTVFHFIENSGNYSTKVVAEAFNTIWLLRYQEEDPVIIRDAIYQSVRNRINFFDPYVQYQSVNCLVMLEVDTERLVMILDNLKMNNTHYQYFLVKKLKELANLGVFTDHRSILDSVFFRKSKHLILTYPEDVGSKMLVKPLFSTDSLLMDIHFNIIGSDGGIIKHGATDLFLVSTAQENNVFSLVTHMSGLESFIGSAGTDATEDVEGLIQLSLFGKHMKPIILFRGTTELMSAIWNAPSDLETVLRGTFIPIDVASEINFQNGAVLEYRYMGSVFLDISYQLTTSIWYKTALSLLRTSGNAYVTMESQITSLSQSTKSVKELTIKTGIDFQTNIDFSTSPIKNCLTISRPVSVMNIKSQQFGGGNSTPADSSASHMKVEGLSYSVTSKMDEMCSFLN